MESSILLYILICLAVFSLSIVAMKAYCMTRTNKEGFTQEADYVVKRGNDIYDSFYYSNYDIVQKTKERLHFDVLQFIKTGPSVQDSQLLDIGFGTGHFLNELQQQYNFKVCGLDLSEDFVSETKKQYPALTLKCGNALHVTNFGKDVFTHITCFHFTLYEIEDKVSFLKNVYYWLKKGGYFIVHIVDVDNFSMVSPAANMREDLIQEFADNRITSTTVLFPDYIYSMNHLQKDNKWKIEESFKDRKQRKRRENAIEFYPISLLDLIQTVELLGFSVKKCVSYKKINGDNNSWLLILIK
jgi:ubiquinone/menaquinone biosynthesis C-methylase UbiE